MNATKPLWRGINKNRSIDKKKPDSVLHPGRKSPQPAITKDMEGIITEYLDS